MNRRHRFDDFDFNAIKLRTGRKFSGLRSLFQVRRGDLLRLAATKAILLPLVAGFLVIGLTYISERFHHAQAIAHLTMEAERAALLMDRHLSNLSAEVENLAVKLAADAAVVLPDDALPRASTRRLIPVTELGIADDDNRALDPLRHIERDMIRRSLELQASVIDVYRDDKHWLLSVVTPVSGDMVLLASYPDAVLGQVLARIASQQPVLLELKYRFSSGWRTLTRRGALEPGPATAQAVLGRPLWAVELTMGKLAYQAWINRNLWLYVVALIAAFAAVVELLLSLLRLRTRRIAQRKLTQDKLTAEQSRELEEVNLIESVFTTSRIEPTDVATETHGDAEDVVSATQSAGASDLDDDFLDLLDEPDSPKTEALDAEPEADSASFDDAVFRAYDIRGIADTQLTTELCRDIGRALAVELTELRQRQALVARDGRNSSPRIRDALVEGLREGGINVTDLGAVPTPLMHFATHELGVGNGFMVTGSHNGREYNGIKMVVAGSSLTEERIHALRDRIRTQAFVAAPSPGGYSHRSIVDEYIARIKNDVVVARRMKVVVDAANGATSPVAPRLFQALGCTVEPLFCELNGDFPNHDPDPTREGNLNALQAAVRAKRADLGIALDGDGDRVVFVTAAGEPVFPDRALMLLAQDVVVRNPGASVVYDVKCSSHLPQLISEAGGVPVMCRSGHSFVKNQLEASGALLGGEFTGHIFFRERWYGFDDGMYVAARMLELLSLSPLRLQEHIARLPESVATPEICLATDEQQKFVIVDQLKAGDYFEGAEINLLDGLRVEFPTGWGLVRASNTGPALSLRFEADDKDALANIQQHFREALRSVDPTLDLKF